MSLILTEQQRQAMVESGGAPIELTDHDMRCYLVAAEEFERMKKQIAAEEIDPSFFEFTEVELVARNDE